MRGIGSFRPNRLSEISQLFIILFKIICGQVVLACTELVFGQGKAGQLLSMFPFVRIAVAFRRNLELAP
ncbi:hypothetical protein CDO26_37110 (plasmid) [Sinorhizobium meliloti]|nr:hypothetical protein CDO26_37110 [Sinorhizobium meliloti]